MTMVTKLDKRYAIDLARAALDDLGLDGSMIESMEYSTEAKLNAQGPYVEQEIRVRWRNYDPRLRGMMERLGKL